MGAAMPQRLYPGSSPMPTVAQDMRSMAMMNTGRRPNLSPKWLNTTPPTGRTTYPTAKAAKAFSSPVVGSADGKKVPPMYWAKVLKITKS